MKGLWLDRRTHSPPLNSSNLCDSRGIWAWAQRSGSPCTNGATTSTAGGWGSKPDIKSAAISTPGSDFPAAFRTSLVEISAHQASVRVIQHFTSQRCFEGWQEEGNKVGYAFFQLSIFEFRRDSCIYDQSCVLCSARSSKDVQAGRERSGIKEVGRVDGSGEEANRGTRGSGTEGARA
jgi:hypothetical protein